MSRLYANPEAGSNWYLLLEELSELRQVGGHVALHKTIPIPSRQRPEERQSPPVYWIEYVPHHWEQVSRETMERLYEISDRHEATLVLDGKRLGNTNGGSFMATFRHRSGS